MSKYVKEFLKRGLMFCGGGPIVLAIVWLFINRSMPLEVISLSKASISIITVTILAFIVSGITTIYQIEKLHIAIAGLIQLFVIYITYLVVYLINGWFDTSAIIPFTIIFLIIFIIIWVIIYLLVSKSVNKLNKKIENN